MTFPTYFTEEHALSITLRDYFAAKAMPTIMKDWYEDGLHCGDDDNSIGIAVVSYKMADAMIKAREL